MDEQKIKEVFSDEEFVKGLFELDTAEEVQAAVKQRGLELSREDVVSIRDVLIRMQEKGGELSEEELENIGGGIAACVGWGMFMGFLLTTVILGTSSKTW